VPRARPLAGFGVPCRGQRIAFRIYLSDWRELDRAVENLGSWLANEDLRGEIVLMVTGVPELL
jgi:hypothetical protein